MSNVRLRLTKVTLHYLLLTHCLLMGQGVAVVLADRAFSRQPKMRNLTDNLSKMRKKAYSEAVIGQFKTLFLKPTNIRQFFSSTSVTNLYPWSDRMQPHLAMRRGPWQCLSGPWDLIWIYHNRTTDFWTNETFVTNYDKTVGLISHFFPCRLNALLANFPSTGSRSLSQ